MSQFIISNDIMYLILFLILIGAIILLWRITSDRTTSLSFIDLIAIDGKLNERKITRFGAWIVSTWGFVYLIIADKFTEWYFLGYMGAWVANALIGKALGNKDHEEYTPQTYYTQSHVKPYYSRAKPIPLDRDPEL